MRDSWQKYKLLKSEDNARKDFYNGQKRFKPRFWNGFGTASVDTQPVWRRIPSLLGPIGG